MYSQPGYTVTPQISYTEDGQEVISGFDAEAHVDYGNPQENWYQDARGEYHYQTPEDPDVYEDADTDGEYQQALMQAYPSLAQALPWAGRNLPEESQEWYNERIDSGDPELMNQAIEFMLNAWAQSGNSGYEDTYEEILDEQSEDYDSDEESEEITQEELDEVINELYDAEMDEDIADEYDKAGLEALQADMETLSDVCQLTAAFHRGEMTAQEAIQIAFANHNTEDLAEAWEILQQWEEANED